jgi:hypothetical protein
MQVSEMRTQGRVDWSVYQSYFAAGGSCCFILLVFGLCILVQVATRSGDYWMAYWYVISIKEFISGFVILCILILIQVVQCLTIWLIFTDLFMLRITVTSLALPYRFLKFCQSEVPLFWTYITTLKLNFLN